MRRGAIAYLCGQAHIWEGRPPEARRVLQDSLAYVEERFGRTSPNAANHASLLAAAAWASGSSEDARLLLAGRLHVLNGMACAIQSVEAGLLTASRLACEDGDVRRALGLLERLAELSHRFTLPRLRVAALREMLHIHCREGHASTCATLLQDLQAARPVAGAGWQDALIDMHAEFGRAFAAAANDDWRRAAQHAATAESLASRQKLAWDNVQARLLHGLALERLGEDAGATLQEALSLSRLSGFPNIAAATHPMLPEMLARLSSGAARPDGASAPAARARPDIGNTEAHVLDSGLLTPKERDLLSLLVRGLSNKEVARATDLSEHTVKWHLKNLFAKLEVGTRRHAVDRARVLGIVVDRRH
jgi:LuxR family maltose regulon positive regulatory protein